MSRPAELGIPGEGAMPTDGQLTVTDVRATMMRQSPEGEFA
jgi:hypothetical protein